MIHLPGLTFDHGEDIAALRASVAAFSQAEIAPRAAEIDRSPAAHASGRRLDLVFQQPQVDVVQRERQAHAQPQYAGSDFQGGAHGGQGVAEGVFELGFKSVHGVLT